jgi:hypothetical protein
VPTRALIVFCFGVALLGGYSLDKLGKHNNSLSRLLASLAVFIILCDLFSVSAPTLSNAAKTLTTPYWKNLRIEQKSYNPKLYRIPPSSSSGLLQTVPSVHQPFTQISIPFAERNAHGAWSDQYLPLLQNTGVVDAYETIPFERYIHAKTDEEYIGEYYLTGEGSVSLKKWSPNKLLFQIKSENKDRLIINQNFDHGWRSSQGHTTSHKGLLAIDLSSGDYELEVYYLPKSFNVGVCVLLITLGSILLIALGQRITLPKT